MQAILIAGMPYTCNSCGDAISDIDVTKSQCHCMSYDIFQKFIFSKNDLTQFMSESNQLQSEPIRERPHSINLRIVFNKLVHETAKYSNVS